MSDVHTEHCCFTHGCKYSDHNCTVLANGPTAQSYLCEECEHESLIIPTKENIKNASPGRRIVIPKGTYRGTWLHIADVDPPYTSHLWVEIHSGKVCFHWSYLAKELEK